MPIKKHVILKLCINEIVLTYNLGMYMFIYFVFEQQSNDIKNI